MGLFDSSPKSGGSTTTTPWAASQPYLKDIMGKAQGLFNSGSGQQYFPGSTVSPFSSQTNSALGAIQNTAQGGGGTALANQSIGNAQGILNGGGLNSTQTGALGLLGNIANGSNGITTGGQYQGLLNSNSGPTSSATNLAGLASAGNVGTLSDDYLKGQSYANEQAQTALMRSLSGAGRFGGNAATAGAFAHDIGGQNAQQNAAELARQQGLMLQANQQIDASNQGQLAGQLGILNGLTGTQGQNIANQMSAANSQFAGGQQGIANQLGVMGLLPTLNDARYYDANKLLGVGDAYDQKAQQQLQSDVDRWNFNQSAPTSALGNYLNFISGATGNYSTKASTVPGGSPLGGILGGALSGATAGSAFGPIGTALGGLGGGILGGFG
jgi:hypothetical protein